MSTNVTLPRQLEDLSPVELEVRFGLARGDVEYVTASSESGTVATLRDGVTLPLSSKAEFDAHLFANVTAAQAVQWIEVNVTNLATAKAALKRLAEFCVYLRDRS